MKQQYERIVPDVTRFSDKDIIVTSDVDRNNAYRSLSELNESDSRVVPIR